MDGRKSEPSGVCLGDAQGRSRRGQIQLGNETVSWDLYFCAGGFTAQLSGAFGVADFLSVDGGGVVTGQLVRLAPAIEVTRGPEAGVVLEEAEVSAGMADPG